MARLTLNGMYQYEPSLFDGMILPADYDREALFAEIMTRCGQLYPYHQQPLVLKSNIRLWFARNYLNFDRTMEALLSEYNPIENYDRNENWMRTPNLNDTETRTGTDTQAHSGSDTDTHTGNNTLALSGTDTVALSGKDTVKDSGTDTVALSGTDTTTLSGTDTVALSGTDATTLSGTDTIAFSGKDTVQDSGTDTETRTYTNYHEIITNTGSKTTEEQVSAFDSSAYEPSKKTIETPAALNEDKQISGSYADATAHGKKEETTYGKSEGTTYGKSESTTYGKSEGTTYGKSEGTTYGKSEGTTYGKQEETTYGKSEGTTYGRQETDTHNTTDATTYNSQEATTYGTKFTHSHTGNEQYVSHIHGNIGVTTSQQMIQSEIELRQFDIYTDIARRFEYEFMVQVY